MRPVCLSALLLTLTGPVAAAEPTPNAEAAPSLAIVPPRLRGGDNAALAGRIAADLADGLANGKVRVLPAIAVARVAGADCGDAACLQRLRRELGADFVLRPEIAQDDRDFTLQLELVDNRSGAVIARSDDACELCGLAELRALAAGQVARMLVTLDAAAAVAPRLRVVTAPPGAAVTVDGRLVGVTPYDQEVLPGEHSVEVTYERHTPATRRFTARMDAVTAVAFELRRTPETLRLRRGGWTALALGIAVAAGGLTLLALDDRCKGSDVDREGDCRRLWSSAWGGAGLLAGGTALATTGAVLLVRTRKRGGRVQQRAAIGPGGLRLAF